MRGRQGIVLLLLGVTFAAMVASADIDPGINDEPTGRKLSACYDCHKDGGGSYGPAMTDTYLIHSPESTIVPVGEKVEFTVGVQNVWTAEVDRIVAAIDVSGAPGLAHASARADLLETIDGEIVVDQTRVLDSQTDFFERITFNIEGGVTDLRIAAVPTHQVEQLQGTLGLRLWPSSADTSKRVDPNFDFQAPAPGGEVSYEASGASNIVALGVGTWTAEVYVQDVFNSANPASLVNQPYTLTVEQFFKESADPVAFGGSDEVLPDSRVGSPVAQIPFILTLGEMPSEPGTLNIRVDARLFYDHAPSVSQDDQWIFTKDIELVITPVPGENAVEIKGTGVIPTPDLIEGIAWDRISEVIGYVSGFLIVASIYTGGMFGKTSRRQLNSVFGTAKRRVAFHNFLSYGILLAAVVHTILFIFVESAFDWTKGIIWGGIAILAMLGLGVTGAVQVPMIRKWNYATWRWSHFYLAIATMVFTVVHIFLDGQNFADFQSTLGYTDPFD